VSLSGGFGEVRLGRDWTPTFRSFQNFEPFGTVGVASGFNVRGAFYSNAGLTAVAVRNSNSVTYFLPSLGGVTGSVQVSAGENAVNQNKSLGGHLEYSAGPILVAAGYDKLAKTLAMVDDLKTVNVGASFNAGFATVMGVYDKSQYSTLEQKIAVVSLVVPVGAGVIKAQYTKASGTGPTATPKLYDAKAYGLGYVYNMSKRSSLYANYGSIDNGANAKFVATGSVPAAMKAGETSKGYEFGIRHNF
jgi:predicted porin